MGDCVWDLGCDPVRPRGDSNPGSLTCHRDALHIGAVAVTIIGFFGLVCEVGPVVVVGMVDGATEIAFERNVSAIDSSVNGSERDTCTSCVLLRKDSTRVIELSLADGLVSILLNIYMYKMIVYIIYIINKCIQCMALISIGISEISEISEIQVQSVPSSSTGRLRLA